MTRLGLVLALCIVATGCGHVSKLRPTPKGAVALEGALGGPAAQIGSLVAFVPLTTVGASYGVADRVDVSAHVHPTSLLFSVVGLDVGASWLLLEQSGAVPTLTLGSALYGFAGLRGGVRPYLELSSAASWSLSPRWSGYVSLSGLGQLTEAPLWAAALGTELKLGRGALQLELRWYNPHADSSEASVEWISPGGRGAIGIVFGGRFELQTKETAP